RLIQYDGPVLRFQPGQPRLTTFLNRQKAFKYETVARQATLDKRWNKSGCPGQRFYPHLRFYTGPYQQKAGVRYPGRTGIRDERKGRSCRKPGNQAVQYLMLIMLMKGKQLLIDLIML